MAEYGLHLDWWAIVVSLGTMQGIVLTVVLFLNKKGNRAANNLLGILILLFVWIHLEYLSLYTRFFFTFPHFYGTRFGIWMLFGPLFYFYVIALTTEKCVFKKLHLLHFLPALAVIALFSEVFQTTSNKVASIQQMLSSLDNPNSTGGFAQISKLIFILQFLHMLFYIMMTRRVLQTYSTRIKDAYSNLEKVGLNWLKRLFVGFSLILCLSYIFYLALFVVNFYAPFLDYIYTLPMTVFIYAIGFNAMLHPEVYRENLCVQVPEKKYEKSSLKESEAQQYAEKLLTYMETEKPYMNNDLKLTTLAKHLDMSTHHLSQIINERLNLNFFDFVNKYRVEEAKRILSKRTKYEPTLWQVAIDAGFNNKVSFNNYFKKFTGTTPSEFKKSTDFNS